MVVIKTFSYSTCQWIEAEALKIVSTFTAKCVDIVENAEWELGF